MKDKRGRLILLFIVLVVIAGCKSEKEFIAAGASNASWEPVYVAFDGVPMVKVPGGCFTIGRNDGPLSESPMRRVCLNEFWIGQTEVTNAQYDACVAAGACTEPMNAVFFLAPTYASHPVVNVTWEQADTYARWRGGSLPTEAQWEYAARGPQGSTYPWGEGDPNCDRANTGACVNGTAAAGTDQRFDGVSWVGALDMGGNVWEWVDGWYSEGSYIDWEDGEIDPVGPAEGQMRVLRGGAWGEEAASTRSTFRSRHLPNSWNEQRGFRIVLPGRASPDEE